MSLSGVKVTSYWLCSLYRPSIYIFLGSQGRGKIKQKRIEWIHTKNHKKTQKPFLSPLGSNRLQLKATPGPNRAHLGVTSCSPSIIQPGNCCPGGTRCCWRAEGIKPITPSQHRCAEHRNKPNRHFWFWTCKGKNNLISDTWPSFPLSVTDWEDTKTRESRMLWY